jgi:hypothetical protein
MKRILLITLLVATILISAACSTTNQGTTIQSGTPVPAYQRTQTTGNVNTQALPVSMELALGAFKLDDTQNAIDAAQAAKLLPLWKAVRALGKSDTTAPEETQALWKQIQNTMTPEQMQAIDQMNLSFRDMESVAQEFGLDLGMGGGFGTMSASVRETAQANRNSGQEQPGRGEGGFPGGGGPSGEGQAYSPEARQTAIAASGGSTSSGSMGLNTALLDAVISFLEAKTE